MIYEDTEKLDHSPLVSIFIFTYNQERFVGQTIESCINQECSFPFEVIICDDCSKDSTLRVCLKYQESYKSIVRVVENEHNLGLRDNYFINILKYTRGKYLACCAGDDWWHDCKKIEKQVSFMESHPEYDLVHTQSAVYVDKTQKYAGRVIGSAGNSFEKNLLTNHVAALTMCYTLSSFKKYVAEMNPMTLPYSEDYPMVLWYSYRCKVYFMNDITCTYRYLINSVSHSTNIDKIYKGPKDFYECGMLFVKHFGIEDEKLLKLSRLRYYLDRMNTQYIMKDDENIVKSNKFFIENRYYVFWCISKLFKLFGSNHALNKFLCKSLSLNRKLHPTYQYFK